MSELHSIDKIHHQKAQANEKAGRFGIGNQEQAAGQCVRLEWYVVL